MSAYRHMKAFVSVSVMMEMPVQPAGKNTSVPASTGTCSPSSWM
jgi:hypothetical protein